MKFRKASEHLSNIFGLAVQMAQTIAADAVLLLLEGPADWMTLKRLGGDVRVIVAAESAEHVDGAAESGLVTVVLDQPDSPIHEKFSQALLECVARDILVPGAEVVVLYSAFEEGIIDSFSYIRLDEHLGRLTSRDLRQLGTKVPLETLKLVVDLAVDIGREGREGKPVGTLFVVGDARRVIAASQPAGFDPMKGYARRERRLQDHRVREGIKDIAQLDGAFVVSSDGVVEASCRLLDVSGAGVNLAKGLGARHLAAAAITKKTNAVAVAVSESNGSVRLFQNGQVMLRIEPFRRAMKWKDFEFDPPKSGD